MNQSVQNKIFQIAEKIFPKIVSIRRKIHQYPELAFEEYRTSKLVAQTLKSLGLKVETGIAKTGVIGVLEGVKKGRVVALRADMDALPLQEQTNLPFASKIPGKMHACGHDAHTAMLLGSAMILKQFQNQLNGTVKFIFQPSEEKNPGGANQMIKEGVLNNPKVDYIFGLHVRPDAEAGTIFLKDGHLMASSDEIYIKIKGRGGHGARPHFTIDPVIIASEIVLAIQKITSRFFDPIEPRVLTIASIHAGTATNIIPDEATISGTLRTMNEEWRKKAWKMIEQIVKGITLTYGAGYELKISRGYPVLINDPEMTEFAKQKAIELLGKDKVFEAKPVMGAEDFAYYLQKVPGCFIWLGAGDKNSKHDIHSSKFTINEEAMKYGSSLLTYLAISILSK
ncbi:M20 metallopeptidase family protein [Candidatus Kryptobacter tengchongensis]|uniref:M20 metallopeptidase family protein n=1 Tax=Kryptobacter tengchongensis TaxID=1643429 RepID=UPI0007078638|nr:M20 family metallopeptidase [Candidatus Kryptobacter tengchongensis]CUS76480.1 amidohydrolase [Candidatus Kryptobacter tengchongensis]